jgi:4-amino-4-deoxy-L-arabinose transferase-like glycosyltransferase
MTRKPTAGLAGLLAIVFALKAIVVFQLRHHPLVQPDAGLDTAAYAELAERVIRGDWGLGPGLYYVSPLYIYVLAAVRGLTGSYTAVRLFQVMLGTVAVGFIAAMTREWYGRRTAWIAGGLAALTGLFTFYEALILQTSIDVFLTSAALLCLTLALKRDGIRWWIATGVVFGIQTMNRPQIAISAAGLVVVLLVLRRWRPAIVLAAGLLIGISPAAIRNVVVSSQFSLLSSQGGLNFYIGNHARANGFYQLVPGITPNIKGQQEDTRRVAERALGRALTDTEVSNYFFDQALDWMAAHPGDAALLMIRKFGWVFHAQHVPLPYSYPFYQYDVPTWLRFYIIGPWLLVPLGLVGLVLGRPRLRKSLAPLAASAGKPSMDYLIWVSFVPCYAAAVALFLISERYRLPLLVPLVAGSGAAIDYLIREVSARRIRSLVAPMACLIGIGLLVNTRAVASDGRFDEGVRLAHQFVVVGRFDDAESWVKRLEAVAPRKGIVHESVAMQYRQRREFARALTHLAKAAEIDPSRATVQYALGQTLLDLDRPAEAVPHLQRGVDAGVAVPMAGYDLAVALQRTNDPAAAAAVIPKIRMGDEASQDDWLQVGRLASELHAPAAAEPFFRHAVEMNPNQPGAREQYGLDLLLLNRFEYAAREFTEATRLDPHSATSLSHLAYAEAKLGRLPEARRHATAALALDPADPMALQLAAVLK